MAGLPRITLFHAAQSRSVGAHALMEELGVPYDLHVLNLRKGDSRDPKYLAVNPMGKVPAILHDGALITEQPAVYIYAADLYPQAGLAPAIGDPLRGPYLRWMVFYGSSFEPALMDRASKAPAMGASTCPYGDFDTMMKTLTDQLAKGPFILGEKFTAADVLWGIALQWTTRFGMVPKNPVIEAYIQRVVSRPAIVRSLQKDEELAKAQAS
jgi:glutathione S-transferase